MNSRTKKLAPPRCQRQQWLRDVCQRLSVALMLVMLTTMTVWAQDAPAEFTITFVDEDGTTVLQTGQVAYGQTPVYTGQTPTKAATDQYTYTFAGWTPNIAEVTEDATYTATYSSTPVSYTINYVLYGGTNNASNPATYTCESEDITLDEPTAPENSGYTFDGWYTDANFENGVNGPAIPHGSTGEKTFYAKWLTTVTATVVWSEKNNIEGFRPESVTAILLADGTATDITVTLNDGNNWTATAEQLNKYKNGTEINYSWTITGVIDCYEQSEPQVEGTTTTFTMNLIDHGDCRQPGSEAAVNWSYNTTTKTITIGGTGPMMYYNSVLNDDQSYSNGAPWKAYANEIENVVIRDGITYVGSNTFAHCPHISCVTLPTDQQLYEIGPGAFGDCTSLTSIDIPMSVNKIYEGAFAGCSNLATVTLHYGDGATFTIGSSVFPATTTIIVPITALQSYYNATSWASYKAKLVASGYCGKDNTETTDIDESHNVIWTLIPNGSVTVDLYNQDEDGILVKTGDVTVPALKLTISGTGAMADYTNSNDAPWMVLNQENDMSASASFYEGKQFITELEIGAGISALGANAFNGLKNLTSLTIDEGSELTTIAPNDFTNNLTTVSLPNAVTTIDLNNDPVKLDEAIKNAAWRYYKSRFTAVGGYCGTTANNADGHNLSWTLTVGDEADTNGDYPYTLTITGTGAMADYTIANAPWGTYPDVLTLPEGLTYIGEYAFYKCNFTTVTIPATVTSINSGAFVQATKAVTFAENSQLTTLYNYIFQNCDLTSVTIPASVTTIGYAFQNCRKLEHVAFVEGSESLVMGGTFALCTSLESIDIPARVTSIAGDTFSGCESLKTVTMLGNTPPTLGKNIISGIGPFYNCTSLSVILVPNETAYTAYKSAATWNGTATGEGENTTDYTSMLAPSTITLAGNTSGWTTYCHNYIVSYSVEDGAAYTVSGINDSYVQTAAVENVAPYTPTLVYKENGSNITLTALPATATQNVPTNYNATTGLVTQTRTGFSMFGAASDTKVTEGYQYVDGYSYGLYNGEFVLINADNGIPAHRCILTLAATSAPRLSIVQDNGDMTGIDSISTESGSQGVFGANAEGNIPSLRNSLDRRNLSGQRVGAGYKGIVIVNGRKVVIK